ncbi:MAG: outer membrane protein assembly factor BamC [Burkholderiaceae bacterium]|nr:outer membrane protein assembly factor BamC [Burkholderiaceae bacterium]
MNKIQRLGLLALALSLGACSVLESDKIDYKSASKGASLDVPPDLTQLSRDTQYVVPGRPVTASSYQVGQVTTAVPAAASALGDVRMERAGSQRWLVVDRAPEKLWDDVRDFWQENGFLLVLDQANLGIMETDWAENRAKIPQDAIRNFVGRALDSLYSTSERDKFRTRLERTPAGKTEIYISHRGMIEVFSTTQQDRTVWQPRPADPELEAEFLRRLLVKLGVTQEQSRAIVAAGATSAAARAATVNNLPAVQIDDDFDRAWRRVGLALDRTGFTVEDRDRSQGLYFVRYVEPTTPDTKQPGFFGRIFSFGSSSKPEPAPIKYRIALRSQGTSTTVSVLDATGTPDRSPNAERIVRVLVDELK